jgi:L-fuconolactonase
LIDAHVHVWRIGANGCTWPTADLSAIHRDFGLEDYREAAGGEVAGVLLVQSQEDAADTRWLLGLPDPLIVGIVGWLDFEAPDAAARIRTLAAHPRLKGLRPMVQHRDSNWYDRVDDGAWTAMAESSLVLDALVRPQHLDALVRLAARHPDLTIVVDHAAKPDPDHFDSWKQAIDSVALGANVHCKLSGLVTEAIDIAAAFDVIWRAFGPDRLIWGSDWPVVNLAASHGEWMEIARALIPAEHQAAVFGHNARHVYRLPAGRPDGGKGS